MSPGNSVMAALVLTLFLFSASVVLVLNLRPLYYADMVILKLEDEAGLPADVIRKNYDVLIDYNQIWNRNTLVFPDFPMSESGTVHFREVKRIFDGIQILFAATLLLLPAVWILMRKKSDYRPLAAAGILSVLLPVMAGTACAVNWERFFVVFHHLLFRNDYWLFDPAEDPVIRILPDTYFLHCALLILVCIVSGSVIYWALYLRTRNADVHPEG